jgi:hypothetical protein
MSHVVFDALLKDAPAQRFLLVSLGELIGNPLKGTDFQIAPWSLALLGCRIDQRSGFIAERARGNLLSRPIKAPNIPGKPG